MPYRLGLDIGTNSLGWCVLDLDAEGCPTAIRDVGVRIFPEGRDPQSGTSFAVDRRVARSMRRRRDRYLRRRADLMAALVRHGLMPESVVDRKRLEALDPFELRARGLDQPLTLHEMGRAIFHLHQRRGFRSNRRTDRTDAKESGKIRAAGGRLECAMAEEGARTLGEYLHRRHRDRRPVRARLRGEGAKAEYDFYPQRRMIEREFGALWESQARHHPELTTKGREELRAIMFRQRPLRPVDPGKCALDPARDRDDLDGLRAPWALPLAQSFRIYQDLANLRILRPDHSERPLTVEERDKLAEALFRKSRLTFAAMRKLVKLSAGMTFNLESAKRAHIAGDKTAAVLSGKGRFGPGLRSLAPDQRDQIVERLLSEEDEEALLAWLVATWGLSEEAALAVAGAVLPEGHCRLGRRALSRIVPIMRGGSRESLDPATGELLTVPLTYDEAARRAGYHHSDRRPTELLEELPYYGEALADHVSGTGDPADPSEVRYGRVPNPNVHIGLNQLRRLVNAILSVHGRPTEIVVELVRDLKLGRKRKEEIDREQAENQRRNDLRREKLAELGERDSGENLLKLRLWEELNLDDPLDRRCVYSGSAIGPRLLLSDEVEIDHILPFSRTLDNSPANKIVCMRDANREKGPRAPFDAFGPDPERWSDILSRAQGLPRNKRWRFTPEAMERFAADQGFLDRQLTDTAYLARLTREYLTHVCPANAVWAVPGRLTAMLRGKWGLNWLLSDANLKARVDHRHHAIDAFVAAVTDRGMLQRIATAAEQSRGRLIDNMPEPWDGFRDDLRDALLRVVVSHKPEQGVQGKLHEETAYGLVADPARENGCNLVARKGLTSLTEKEVERVRDPELRTRLRDHVHDAKGAGISFKQALSDFSSETGVRRVRVLKREAEVIGISGADGRPYKAYIPGDNHCIEIFETPDGEWAGEAITMFQANQAGHQAAWKRNHPAACLVMRVHKGDLLRLDRRGMEEVMRVVRLGVKAGVFWLAGHADSGALQQRHDDPDDSFRWFFASFGKLREYRARKVAVDLLGRVRDPGPPR